MGPTFVASIWPKKLAPDPSCKTRKPQTWNLFLSASGLRLAAASLPDLFSTGEALYSEIKFLCFLRPHFMHLRWGVVMARVFGEGLHNEIKFADI